RTHAKKQNPIPICPLPYHSPHTYIHTLLNNPYKLPISQHIQHPKQTKPILTPQLLTILTPPTLIHQPALHH
ncbi:hypothetical protein, partial [Staphylococcus aureus]|uniref:hypothetical protein n=1 Tax=Staphylococcus aureus TaxID=1280 RepID=UPI0016423FCC